MAVNRNTYGLPDETLQLIASSPELSVPMMKQGGSSRPDLIAALRNIPGAANPGFTRYANAANGAGLTVNPFSSRGANSPSNLKMALLQQPNVQLPVAETPYERPTDWVKSPGDFVIDETVYDDPVVDPETPEPPEDPEVPVGTPLVLDPVVDPEDDPVDPDTVEFEPTELDPFVLDPFVFKEVPEREKIPTVTIETVDPNEEFPQDDGTTDDILELINYLNSSMGGAGGGKPQVDDLSWGELEF